MQRVAYSHHDLVRAANEVCDKQRPTKVGINAYSSGPKVSRMVRRFHSSMSLRVKFRSTAVFQ